MAYKHHIRSIMAFLAIFCICIQASALSTSRYATNSKLASGHWVKVKVDKNGIVHSSIGKVSFTADQIRDNAREFVNTLIKLKPATAKGTYLKSIYLSTTMSPGVKIDTKSVDA